MLERFTFSYYKTLILQRNKAAQECLNPTIPEGKKKIPLKRTLKQLIANAGTNEEVVNILKTFGVRE